MEARPDAVVLRRQVRDVKERRVGEDGSKMVVRPA
jgi:hypothetical protein